MQPRTTPAQIIDRKKYDPSTATLISGDDYWDGSNWERRGTNTFLYRTKKGNYFTEYLTQWMGDNNRLSAVSEDEATEIYESHQANGDCRIDFKEAFPGVEIEEA